MTTITEKPDGGTRAAEGHPSEEREPQSQRPAARLSAESKAETEREYDMPGADIVTVRRAFFRRVKVREKTPKTDD